MAMQLCMTVVKQHGFGMHDAKQSPGGTYQIKLTIKRMLSMLNIYFNKTT